MTDKKRILFVGEASCLSTGFSNYYRDLLPRLHATGKYEIGEISSYIVPGDPRMIDWVKGRWKWWGTMPLNQQEAAIFNQPSKHPHDKAQNTAQFGSLIFDQVVADFKPDFVCVPPGELVFTARGYRPIEAIKAGDLVLTHKGRFCPVVQSMRRQYVGNIRHIFFNGCSEPLRLTPEHPVLVYRKRSQTNQKKRIDEIYHGVEPEFVLAKDVAQGDLVVLPIGPESNSEYQILDLTNYLINYIAENDKLIPAQWHREPSQNLNRYVKITPEFGRLLGYLLTDGSYKTNTITISFGIDEERFAKDAISIIRSLFSIEATYSIYNNSCRVIANSTLLAEFIRKILAYKSEIPQFIWEAPKPVREQFLAGLVRGDGCYKKCSINFTNTRRRLSYNVRMLYTSLGIPSTLVKINHPDRRNVYEVNISTDKYIRLVHDFIQKYPLKQMHDDVIKSAARVNKVNNHIVASVRRNRTMPYNGQVYNLEVSEDNSYILQSSVHNCDIRDWWMLSFEQRSPFRPWFKWLIMPTVDSIPQDELWVQYYEQADLVMAYSDFGVHSLRQQSPKMKIYPKPMRPPVDAQVYRPMDKSEVRKKYLLREDLPIIGTVMRNQSRKLYLDLLDAFALMKNKYADQHKEVKDAVLLIHSSWPDNAYSYDYPRHIMRLHSYQWMQYHRKGIKDDILQTLMCMNPACGKYSIGHAMMLWNKPIQNGRVMQFCKHCQQMSACCPTSGANSFSREGMAEVLNLMDVYVQCSIAEGCGMPVNEAKACGVPTIVTDYSALAEKGRLPAEYKHIDSKTYTVHKGGLDNKVIRFRHEPETGCFRALPDIDDLAEKMKDLLIDKERRIQLGKEARECALENYDADALAKQWEFVLDSVKIKDRSQTWDTPIVVKETNFPSSIPPDLSDDQFFEWLYTQVLRYPKADPEGIKYWEAQLAQGATREQLFEQFKGIAKGGEDAENVRNKIRSAVAGVPANEVANSWV